MHLTPVEYEIVPIFQRTAGKVMTYAIVMENVQGTVSG